MVELQQEPEPETTTSSTTTLTTTTWKQNQTIQTLSEKLTNGNLNTKIEAAREIRRMVRKSSKTRSKIADAGVIQPLIFMLSSSNIDARQSSLLALLNLAVRNERYKDLFFFIFFSSSGFWFSSLGIVWIVFSLCNVKWIALNLWFCDEDADLLMILNLLVFFGMMRFDLKEYVVLKLVFWRNGFVNCLYGCCVWIHKAAIWLRCKFFYIFFALFVFK